MLVFSHTHTPARPVYLLVSMTGFRPTRLGEMLNERKMRGSFPPIALVTFAARGDVVTAYLAPYFAEDGREDGDAGADDGDAGFEET